MTTDSDGAVEREAKNGATRVRITTAGRLLRDVSNDPRIDLEHIAKQLGVPASDLHACRDGLTPIAVELQILLAAMILDVAPEYGRRARQLHAQAQSALRIREGSVESHMTYNWPRFR